jgi:hypothetical protein
VCLWTIFRITFSNSLLIVDKRLMGCKFWGILGPYQVPVTITFASFQGFRNWDSRRQWLKICFKIYQWSSWKMPEAFVWSTISVTIFRRRVMSGTWWCWNFLTHLYAINSVVSRLDGWKLRYSKMDV